MLGPTIPITLPNHIYFILISHLPKVHINFQNMFNPNVTVIHIIVVYTFSLCIMYLPTYIASSCTVLQNWKNTAERPLPHFFMKSQCKLYNFSELHFSRILVHSDLYINGRYLDLRMCKCYCLNSWNDDVCVFSIHPFYMNFVHIIIYIS